MGLKADIPSSVSMGGGGRAGLRGVALYFGVSRMFRGEGKKVRKDGERAL